MQEQNQVSIDANTVTAQTAALQQLDSAVIGEGTTTEAPQTNESDIKLKYGEELIDIRDRTDNKKVRDVAKAKRIKKIAAASRKRNRRA
jgi:hypothetical protein